jgi:hypothetical protein
VDKRFITVRCGEDTLAGFELKQALITGCDYGLGAEWGESDHEWGPVAQRQPGWLAKQTVFCLTSDLGAIDVFRRVKGLGDWNECRARAYRGKTASDVEYLGLSDEDMLRAEEALEKSGQRRFRLDGLRKAVQGD